MVEEYTLTFALTLMAFGIVFILGYISLVITMHWISKKVVSMYFRERSRFMRDLSKTKEDDEGV